MDTEQTVTISAARLAELEAAAQQAQQLKEKLDKRNNNNLERLAAYNQAHPESLKSRKQRYNEKNRDEINAHRREKYKQKKLGLTADCGTTAAVPTK